MSTTDDQFSDPFEEHFRREPLKDAAVLVIVVDPGPPGLAEEIKQSLAESLARLNRPSREIIVLPKPLGIARAIGPGIRTTDAPLILISMTDQPWTEAQLLPLLEAVNTSDHVIGARATTRGGRFARWLKTRFWKLVFAVPVLDVHSPCRLHRSVKLKAIYLQSASDLLSIEILAKATFLGHLIDEVEIPQIGRPKPRVSWSEVNRLFREPHFAPPSRPTEYPEGDDEGDESPSAENDDRGHDIEEAGPFENDGAEAVDQLGEGEELNNGLDDLGEPVGAEEDAGEDPHRQHNEIHEPAHSLGALSTAADEQSDSREGERSEHVEQKHQKQTAADGHAEAEVTQ